MSDFKVGDKVEWADEYEPKGIRFGVIKHVYYSGASKIDIDSLAVVPDGRVQSIAFVPSELRHHPDTPAEVKPLECPHCGHEDGEHAPTCEIKAHCGGCEDEDEYGWTKVEDGLPEVDKDVLVAIILPSGDFAVCCGCLAGRPYPDVTWLRFGPMGSDIEYSVTHWMPLPEPPAGKVG